MQIFINLKIKVSDNFSNPWKLQILLEYVRIYCGRIYKFLKLFFVLKILSKVSKEGSIAARWFVWDNTPWFVPQTQSFEDYLHGELQNNSDRILQKRHYRTVLDCYFENFKFFETRFSRVWCFLTQLADQTQFFSLEYPGLKHKFSKLDQV